MKTRSHGPADVGSGIGLPQGTKGAAKKAVQRAKAFQQAARASSKSHARAQAAQDKRQRAQRQRDGPGPAGPAAREEELAFGHVEYAAAAGHVDGKRKASKKALLEQALQEKARLEQLAGQVEGVVAARQAAMGKAMQRARGEKVKDDPKKLRKVGFSRSGRPTGRPTGCPWRGVGREGASPSMSDWERVAEMMDGDPAAG